MIGNILLAMESLHKTGGFTYSFVTGDLNPPKGFSVAISKENEKVIENITRYKKHAIEHSIGLWQDANPIPPFKFRHKIN